MGITTVSSRDFNQDINKSKRAARTGPVFITNRGQPAYVLLTIELYQKITDKQKSIADLLSMPGVADIDFDISRMDKQLYKPASLS